jgi:replicative DNA helicase
MNDVIPPHNLEAERAVLGAMMLDAGDAAYAASTMVPADFYRTGHRVVFQAIMQLMDDDQPPDELLVRDKLTQMGSLDEAGGLEMLRDLSRDVTAGAFIAQHATLILEMATRRRLIQSCSETLRQCYQPSVTVKELIDQAETAMMAATGERNTDGPKPFATAVTEAMVEVDLETSGEADQAGLECGHSCVDQLTGGWRKGELIILAGRPGDGKTSLGLNWSIHASEWDDAHILWFSLEMPRRQLARNALSLMTKMETHTNQIRQLGEDAMAQLRGTAEGAKALPIEIDDAGTLTISALRARARRCHLAWPLDLLVVDYLQLVTGIRPRGASRAEEVGTVSKGLKRLARELDVPTIVMAQLRRDAEGRKPKLTDLKECGDIEQDADKVVFIWKHKTDPHIRYITLGKNRNGPTGTVELRFDGAKMQYVEFED